MHTTETLDRICKKRVLLALQIIKHGAFTEPYAERHYPKFRGFLPSSSNYWLIHAIHRSSFSLWIPTIHPSGFLFGSKIYRRVLHHMVLASGICSLLRLLERAVSVPPIGTITCELLFRDRITKRRQAMDLVVSNHFQPCLARLF